MLPKRCALLVLIPFVGRVASSLQAQELGSARVVSTGGAPLARVWVQELGTWNGTLTKADGLFPVPLGKRAALLLARDGLRPEILLTNGTERYQTVVMQPEAEASFKLCACESNDPGALVRIKLARTPKIHLKRGGDVDFAGYTATYITRGGVPEALVSMTGIHVAGLTPTPDWAKGLSSFLVRSIRCVNVQWIDLRGISQQGLQSRWVGYGSSFVQYSKVSKEAARAFDAAIDHGCCGP